MVNANVLRNLIAFRTRQRDEATSPAERQKFNRYLRNLRKQLRAVSNQDTRAD